MATFGVHRALSRNVKRTALSLALGVCVAGGVQAQSAVGSIFGSGQPGATIVITSPQTGLSRSISAAADGRFTFTQLPTGRYVITSDGQTREVEVKVGSGVQVQFGATTDLGAVNVQGARALNPIDLSSVESTSVFTSDQLISLPVASDVSSVALLAPGTVRGDSGMGSGNLASFGGASVAENGYYINGFDVTNVRTFLSFADLPFQGIAQLQVKTGGYGAEYGRSLGGIVSIVTKAGSNDWHYGGSVEWTPDWGREPGKDVRERDPDAADPLYVYRSDNASSSTVYSAYASGPLIRDRLFFFAIAEGRRNTGDSFGALTSQRTSNTSPQGLLKLDWYINDSNLLEFTGLYNQYRTRYNTYEYDPTADGGNRYNIGRHEAPIEQYEIENGGRIGILKYTGYVTDTFTLSAQYGYLSNLISSRLPAAGPGSECPWAYSFGLTTSVLDRYIGCNPGTISTIPDQDAAPDEDVRKAFRVDAEWVLGDHRLRFGVDRDTYDSSHRGQTYAGGINWAYYRVPTNAVATGAFAGRPGRTVNGELVAPGSLYARSRYLETSSSSYENINSAFYVEDNWQVTDTLLAYIGLRGEKFESRNGDGIAWVESDFEVAPRLGFSWDVSGDASFKLFGTLGRYYIPVATNSSIRATGSEYRENTWYYATGWNEADGRPLGQGAQIGDTQINGSRSAPNPASVASTNLSPMYQDELILGTQVQLTDRWMAGARLTRREVKSGMDDTCTTNAWIDWAADNGYDDFDPASVPGCYFLNPGSDVTLNVDLDGDGTVELATLPASYLGLPEYQRTYTALELFWERTGERFNLQGSYTFARTRGNVEGYVNSTLEQEDPGLTQDFDHRLFTDGTYGPTPNDRQHTLKLFGAYTFTPEWQLGGNLLVQSGRPINCQGYIPLEGIAQPDAGTLSSYSGSSFYCLDDDGTRELHQRGDQGRTPWTWTFDLSAAYVPDWADNRLRFKLDVFNLFNNDKVTEYNEFKEASRDVISRNYLNDVNYQSPRALRLTVRYDY
ncbi:TonB-dependent receptor [Xanthomonas sp. XNM01]|uniref:TonB-dependent receptor n=1 Tax=Xanthomonas sp. XNM01 TaxID=2769289 RepID=UPI0017839B03|nr:TonB-dependent receptor [Xanthomonas sp. XNM01]MBD9368542.1 TonB-dependent receptor [Xanthomonas sp. XNM01]